MSFNKILTSLFCLCIHIYRWTISPLLGTPCRFFPSCSEYALHSLKQHGCFYGTLLIIKRLGKCGPWHPGGIDLVPNTKTEDFLDTSRESPPS